MKRELIEALIDELRENFEALDLKSPYNIREKRCESLSMILILPDQWQQVKWGVDVFSRYGLENTTDNALMVSESDLRNLAKHILSQGKYPAKGERVQHPSIH